MYKTEIVYNIKCKQMNSKARGAFFAERIIRPFEPDAVSTDVGKLKNNQLQIMLKAIFKTPFSGSLFYLSIYYFLTLFYAF